MFLILDRTSDYSFEQLGEDAFDTIEEAVEYADNNDLVDVMIFEFKRFI